MRRYIILSFVCILVYASTAYAQNARVITLNDALTIAKQNNSELIIARLDQTKAERQVSEVYSQNLVPTVTLKSTYLRNFKKQVINIFNQNYYIGTDNSITTTLDVSEAIPVLGTPIFSGIRIAEYYHKLQQENVLKVESKINADVKKAFLNALLLKEVIELNSQSIDDSRENLRVVEARYKAGVALEFDYIRAKVKLETLIPELSKSQNNFEVAKKFLKSTIGLKDNENIDVKGTLSYDSTEVWGTTQDVINNVSQKNVSVRQLLLNKLINEEFARIDYANYLPKFYVFGEYGLLGNEDDGRNFFKYRYFNTLTAGIGMTWDLNLFRNSYKEQQSKIEVMKSEEQIKDVKDKLKMQTESVLLNIEDAKRRIIAQKEIVNQAERGLELANSGFKSGVLNQIDVIDAELGLSQVKLNYLQAIYDYLNARTNLELLLDK